MHKGKLVRDKIPQIIRSKGKNCDYRILEISEYISALKTKLVEEANEVHQAENINEIAEELADLQEVYKSLIKVLNIEEAEIERIRLTKRDKRGGFDDKIWLEKW